MVGTIYNSGCSVQDCGIEAGVMYITKYNTLDAQKVVAKMMRWPESNMASRC